MTGYSIVKGQRKYYKDSVEVPSSSITDFGSYRYFKNVVTTKYWKEITTTVNDVVYACYRIYASNGYVGWYHYYAKTPIGSSLTAYYKTGDIEDLWQDFTNDASQLTPCSANSFTAINEVNATLTKPPTSRHNGKVCDRYPEGDAYGDVTTTTVVEGTPEDYAYTIEEVTTVEVTANDDYDVTEFVPSTQFDYYEGTNKLYQLAKVKRSYYKDGVVIPESSITDFGSTKYYKNIVTTKYWKEITTGSRELGYYCYYLNRTLAGYFYASPKLDVLYYSNVSSNGTTFDAVSSPEQLKEFYSGEYRNLTADSVQVNVGVLSSSYVTVPRLTTGDLYIDTTATETIEGTPEDYTYTTEEIVKTEVTADDDYDYTEFVPSAEFDYYTDRLLSYEIIKGVK